MFFSDVFGFPQALSCLFAGTDRLFLAGKRAELKNMLERAAIVAGKDTIEIYHLAPEISGRTGTAG